MKDFAIKVLSAWINPGQVGVYFLGQAGFVLKTHAGTLTAVDPYLSNCCERYFGLKRLMPQILDPWELTFDRLLLSHAHYDHFDPDSIPILVSGGRTEIIGAKDIAEECSRLHVEQNAVYLACGDTVQRNGFAVTGVPCDHGELAPDALGLLMEVDGKRIYYMGDTAYRPDLLENPLLQGVDLLILPINGAFGNLNEEQAARVVARLQPRLTVPCHYWNFAEHGGNPGLFQNYMAELAPDSPYVLMQQGEGILI